MEKTPLDISSHEIKRLQTAVKRLRTKLSAAERDLMLAMENHADLIQKRNAELRKTVGVPGVSI